MKFTEQKIQGVFSIELSPIEDNRGFFMRAYDVELFKKAGLHRDWVQENHSFSKTKGTLRGLHFQTPPYTETKLVRVIQGAVLDVFVDLREGSQTFGEWGSYELIAERNEWLYLPRGIAHGMCTLTDDMVMQYKVDSPFNPAADSQLKWDDPTLAIKWPIIPSVISEKDTNAMSFESFLKDIGSIKV